MQSPRKVKLDRIGESLPLNRNVHSQLSYNSAVEEPDTISIDSASLYIPRNTDNSQTVPLSGKLKYYIPCYLWMSEYKLSYLLYDIIAGVSLASYQIPLSMSFATALAHVPTSAGLLGLSIGPIMYMLMGTVPQMIIGPEAAVSMIIGQVIERSAKHYPGVEPMNILSVLCFLSGSILLIFGFLRFGYLDNVLCGTLLRGFITAIGLSMILNSIIAMLGLEGIMKELPKEVHVHSAIEKFIFLIRYASHYHKFTSAISLTAFSLLYLLTHIKKMLVQRKFKKVSYFPEILFTIVLFTFLSSLFDFEAHGLDIIGSVKLDHLEIRNPLSAENRELWGDFLPVSFVIAILGFFETSTAAKSLSSMMETPVSSNRELVSLGIADSIVSFFGALPSFGGYARSKLNAMIGAKSPLSGAVMGLTTLIVSFSLLNCVYYLPICVLNSVIAIVGYKMIQETPKELKFHLQTKGWNELITFVVTLLASLYYSIEVGVSMGCFYSLMRVLKHSTQSRIQILTRIAGTDTFVNPECEQLPNSNFLRLPKKLIIKGYNEFRRQSIIEEASSSLDASQTSTGEAKTSESSTQYQDREGCLIIKVAEPLTFFNANDLKSRLKRIELYGSIHEHPGSKRRNKVLRHVVFDLHGMTSIDSSATQILYEIVNTYQKRGINVFFTRIASNQQPLRILKDSGIEKLLELTDGCEFGIRQTAPPYYDEILDALKAIDKIDTTCDWETQSFFSTFEL
ncbi:hypothetical protein CANINC_002217 [Pichia inconspicua]|uniref:STAS domain-containing protein n=1 Tax=Pichia inconspicua TaxID=52247 RepID=A0A4T0X1P7_9ASCO|nr:hypothetical protein CANINC_002217 [[Candida] inconspicua]